MMVWWKKVGSHLLFNFSLLEYFFVFLSLFCFYLWFVISCVLAKFFSIIWKLSIFVFCIYILIIKYFFYLILLQVHIYIFEDIVVQLVNQTLRNGCGFNFHSVNLLYLDIFIFPTSLKIEGK